MTAMHDASDIECQNFHTIYYSVTFTDKVNSLQTYRKTLN